MGLWIITGLTFPTWLHLRFGSIDGAGIHEFESFLASQIACGGISSTITFFLINLLMVRVYFPVLLRNDLGDGAEGKQLLRLERRSSICFYLTVTASFVTPILALALIISSISGDLVKAWMGILSVIGFVSCFASFKLLQVIRYDLEALAIAIEHHQQGTPDRVGVLGLGGRIGALPSTDVDGLEVLRHARKINPSVIAIMITAFGSPDLMKGVEQLGVTDALGAVEGDLVLIAAGPRPMVRAVLGQLRLELGRPPVDEGGLQFLWVVDFPLFEAGADGQPIPMHHPFTMPHPEDMQLLDSDPVAARAQAYDLVLNGWELGSGSVRIHRPDLQQRIFSLLGIAPEDAQARFGFLLDAFRYGAPPHAGFAVGIDRFVAILSGEENIREVIAFPKTQSGADPLTGAPTPIDATQLKELGLSLTKPPPQK
jgi:hypothetical protein